MRGAVAHLSQWATFAAPNIPDSLEPGEGRRPVRLTRVGLWSAVGARTHGTKAPRR